MSDERIGVALDGAIGRIEIRRPDKKNAIDTDMAGAIEDGLGELIGSPACKVVVIAGSGGVFSAGADLSEGRSDPGAAGRRTHAAMLRAVAASTLPVVALVDGWAIGIGAGIVGAATFAVAGRTARFMLPESKLGYIPFTVAPYLAMRVAPERVLLWSLGGEAFEAAEAHAHGLVTHREEDADADEAAAPLLEVLCGRDRSIVEDGMGFVQRARGSARWELVEFCDAEMARVGRAMSQSGSGEKEGST